MNGYWNGDCMFSADWMAKRVYGQAAPYIVWCDGSRSGFRIGFNQSWAVCDDFGNLVQVMR